MDESRVRELGTSPETDQAGVRTEGHLYGGGSLVCGGQGPDVQGQAGGLGLGGQSLPAVQTRRQHLLCQPAREAVINKLKEKSTLRLTKDA